MVLQKACINSLKFSRNSCLNLRSFQYSRSGQWNKSFVMASLNSSRDDHRRGFQALIVSLDEDPETKKKKAKHEIVSVDSFDELPFQKASSKWTDKMATVQVEYSTLNYKDGLVLQGKPGVAKSFPIVPGMDFAGTVLEDPTNKFKAGTNVLLTGNYLGQHLNGAYAQQCLVPSEWMLELPQSISKL